MKRALLLLVITFYTIAEPAADVRNNLPDQIEVSTFFDNEQSEKPSTETPIPDDDSWDEMADDNN